MHPIKYSTISKLTKEGLINDSHLIGSKLTSEAAKELYKQNIRVHPRHYIPKDAKKFFHDAEIKGGKLGLVKAFKKVGTVAKHALEPFENIGSQAALGIKKVETGLIKAAGSDEFKAVKQGAESLGKYVADTTMGTVQALAPKNVAEYTDVVLHGRNDYPPKVRDLIKKYGNKVIKSITADRTPVVEALVKVMNIVSLGKFKKRLDKKTPYDTLFHLRIDITFDDGKRLAVEKNEVINMYENPKKLKDSEQKVISSIPAGLTLNALLDGGKKMLGGKFFTYSASSNNCQDFIIALLKGSGIGNEQDYTFIKQDTDVLFKRQGFLKKISNAVTSLGAKVNEITQGAGVHSENSICGGKISLNKTVKKVGKYVTSKKGGLASDLITYGIPAVSSAALGGVAGLATGGNPAAEIAASALGAKLGTMGAEALKEKTGTGLVDKFMKTPKCPIRHPPRSGGSILPMPDKLTGDLVHIDIGSHNASGRRSSNKMEGGKLKLKRTKNTALEQLLEARKEKDAKELQKNLLEMSKTVATDLRAIRGALGAGAFKTPLRGISQPPLRGVNRPAVMSDKDLSAYVRPMSAPTKGRGFKKGSEEAKAHMARIRAMRGLKK